MTAVYASRRSFEKVGSLGSDQQVDHVARGAISVRLSPALVSA